MTAKVTKSKAKSSSKTLSRSKSTAKKTVKKTVKKTTKKPFGGYAINFAGRKETVEQVFGKKPIPPSQMTKKIWEFVKANDLSTNSK